MVKVKRERKLGFVQRQVLITLADGEERSATDWAAWYPMQEAQVRKAIDSLSKRGLVDVAGWDTGHHGREVRTFAITNRGLKVVAPILEEAEQCPHGCGRLAEGGSPDMLICPVCDDEWATETIRENRPVSSAYLDDQGSFD